MLSYFGKCFGVSSPFGGSKASLGWTGSKASLGWTGRNSLLSSWNILPPKRNDSFIRLCDQKKGFQPAGALISDGVLEMARPSQHTVLQITDLHHYANGSREDAEGIKLIATLAERVRPDLVVFTGDIIDARYCGSPSCFQNVVAPLVKLQIPWTYVPGNHDDETKKFTRKDLLSIYKLPFCASKNARSFNHVLHVGPLQVYLIDSHGYVENDEELLTYDHIKQDQIDWYSKAPISGECGVAFFHIPLVEYHKAKILKGHKGEQPCTPAYNSGLFKAIREKKDVHGLFVGHDHWNDFTSVLNGIWLCYGRVSGFTHSTVYGNTKSPANKERGGRVIRYDSVHKLLLTWVENRMGMEKESLISKQIQVTKETQLK